MQSMPSPPLTRTQIIARLYSALLYFIQNEFYYLNINPDLSNAHLILHPQYNSFANINPRFRGLQNLLTLFYREVCQREE